MIELNRSMENKWILQKNISSSKLLKTFVEALSEDDNEVDKEGLKNRLKDKDSYQGRSDEGSSSTMGVRLSQACFYMFGYKKDQKFFPSPMTNLFLKKNREISDSQIALINLYSMQYPNHYSDINDNFRIYIGRLFVKLLLETRLDEKLYIDECIYFLMFLEKIDQNIYNQLVDSILEFRNLTYEKKLELFESVDDYQRVFGNATHEMNYYFLRIFAGFGVFEIIPDSNHNSGKLFDFKQGNTKRYDAYAPNKSFSGYVIIAPDIKNDAMKLNENFNTFDLPPIKADELTTEDWIREIYQFKPLEYIDIIMSNDEERREIIQIIKNMVYNSKFGSRDGRSFEISLKPFFELFEENRVVEIHGGSGDTDLVCTMDDNEDNLYKINVDAKTTRRSTSSIIARRINDHIRQHGSKYCIIVSPRFARGVKRDIENNNIVTIEAETLADYCLKECLSSDYNLADFTSLDVLISDNLGTDITKAVDKLIEIKYGD